jgi:hypothetical protein
VVVAPLPPTTTGAQRAAAAATRWGSRRWHERKGTPLSWN